MNLGTGNKGMKPVMPLVFMFLGLVSCSTFPVAPSELFQEGSYTTIELRDRSMFLNSANVLDLRDKVGYSSGSYCGFVDGKLVYVANENTNELTLYRLTSDGPRLLRALQNVDRWSIDGGDILYYSTRAEGVLSRYSPIDDSIEEFKGLPFFAEKTFNFYLLDSGTFLFESQGTPMFYSTRLQKFLDRPRNFLLGRGIYGTTARNEMIVFNYDNSLEIVSRETLEYKEIAYFRNPDYKLDRFPESIGRVATVGESAYAVTLYSGESEMKGMPIFKQYLLYRGNLYMIPQWFLSKIGKASYYLNTNDRGQD